MNLMKYRWIYIGIFIATISLSIAFIFVNPYNGWGLTKIKAILKDIVGDRFHRGDQNLFSGRSGRQLG